MSESDVTVRGIGITIYPGSASEGDMLSFAAHAIHEAHQHGLIAIVWAYLRGKHVEDEQDPALIAGAAGLANALGADFVKVKPPHATAAKTSAQHLATAVSAAGNTRVICSGLSLQEPEAFLQQLYDQINIGGTAGCATGRNIFQRSKAEAVAMTEAISAIVYDNKTASEALALFKKGR